MKSEERPAPSWLGDVGDGVDAWTHGTGGAGVPEPSAGRSETDGHAGRSRWPERGGRARQGGSRRWGSGEPLPEDQQALGPEADAESVARTILLDQLTGRARSRQELATKLRQKAVPEEVAERLLDRFEEVGLVDDEAFARTWVDQRGRTRGRAMLRQELRRKGVDDETTREVLDEIDGDDEAQAARELVRKKLRTLSRVDDTTATRRLVGMLARKGYGSGMAFAVVKSELADAGREEPEEPHSI